MSRTIKNVQWHRLERLATEDRVVDDRVVSFEVATEGLISLLIGTRGEMHLTPLFHMREGKRGQPIGMKGRRTRSRAREGAPSQIITGRGSR
jgi:hypothetical protein